MTQREKLLREKQQYTREYAFLLSYTMKPLRVITVKGYTAANRRKLVIKATVAKIDEALGMAL
jgi:hypothetical protein